MTSILQQIGKRNAAFHAEVPSDVTAIALMKLLGTANNQAFCKAMASQYPGSILAAAARELIRASSERTPQAFMESLERSRTTSGGASEIIACKCERRVVATAVMRGGKIASADIRNLSSDEDKALASAAGFVRSILEEYKEGSVAVEILTDTDTRRAMVVSRVQEVAREEGHPIRDIPVTEVCGALSIPPCRTRQQARLLLASIFPHIRHKSESLLDAAGVGLTAYVNGLFEEEGSL